MVFQTGHKTSPTLKDGEVGSQGGTEGGGEGGNSSEGKGEGDPERSLASCAHDHNSMPRAPHSEHDGLFGSECAFAIDLTSLYQCDFAVSSRKNGVTMRYRRHLRRLRSQPHVHCQWILSCSRP